MVWPSNRWRRPFDQGGRHYPLGSVKRLVFHIVAKGRGDTPINSWHHAQSAAKKWGGTPEDYIKIEEFIDSSKKIIGDVRHRSMYHHTAGVWLCQEIFGVTLGIGKVLTPRQIDEGISQSVKLVPVRLIAERHVLEDLGWLPSPKDYIDGMVIKPWMSGAQRKELPLSHLLGEKKT